MGPTLAGLGGGADVKRREGAARIDDTSKSGGAQDKERRTDAVMLALSTFRRSDEAVDLALEKAAGGGDLIIVYVADVNLARYFIGTDLGFYPELKKRYEEELLREHEQKGVEVVGCIGKRAEGLRIVARTYVRIGRFASECMKVIAKEKPGLIITTRSRRPAWVKRFFGSPVDYLVAHAGCLVIEA